ncbi:IS1634 family transposase [Okeania sp. SIO1I7]|uniref:IS1634 family transposase n=1 Tax=Okeania sp. SIO1I7 TaxID=2607772 RepID=UPI0013FB0FE3|nr:IS1634 family transposase [Okeania sp. SIO1I7]NET27639.1 IS1634 family transposase [Okeania sp. SIO1I7]
MKNLDKKIQKERAEVNKQLRTLKSEKFACIPDAQTAKRKLLNNFLDHELKQINVQEVESKYDTDFPYEVQVQVNLRESKIELEKKRAGRFILATNILDRMELTKEEMLSKYKGQQSVERGFRFLKDPLFLTDSIFLKSPH